MYIKYASAGARPAGRPASADAPTRRRPLTRVGTEVVTFGRGGLSVCPLGGFAGAHEWFLFNWKGVPQRAPQGQSLRALLLRGTSVLHSFTPLPPLCAAAAASEPPLPPPPHARRYFSLMQLLRMHSLLGDRPPAPPVCRALPHLHCTLPRFTRWLASQGACGRAQTLDSERVNLQ